LIHMSWIHALIIGILQGLTEFFPVSSSAHLKLARMIFGIESGVLFDLACHLGTLGAALYFLRRDILALDRKKIGSLVLATLPLVPAYFLLKSFRVWAAQPQFLGVCFLLTAGLLFLGHSIRLARVKKSSDALWIGVMQTAALIPGISRSGSTISAAQMLGWDPKEAVRFSFLLSIPTILGGNCIELLKLLFSESEPLTVSFASCLIGFLSSLGVGLIMIKVAIGQLEKGNLKPFAFYCLMMGLLICSYFLWLN